MVVEGSIKALFLGKSRERHLDSPEVCSRTELAPVARADCISDPKGWQRIAFQLPRAEGSYSGKLSQLSGQFFFHVSGLKNTSIFPFATKSKSWLLKDYFKSRRASGF